MKVDDDEEDDEKRRRWRINDAKGRDEEYKKVEVEEEEMRRRRKVANAAIGRGEEYKKVEAAAAVAALLTLSAVADIPPSEVTTMSERE